MTGPRTLCAFQHLVKPYGENTKEGNICKSCRAVVLFWVELASLSVITRDQYTFKSRVRRAITKSHLIRNKANVLTQSSCTMTTVGGRTRAPIEA